MSPPTARIAAWLAGLMLVCVTAQGRPKGDPGAELGRSFSKRFSQRLGLPVRLHRVAYQFLQSTFTIERVELGPSRRPYLRSEQIDVAVMLGQPGQLRLVAVTRPRLRIAHHWFSGQLVPPGNLPGGLRRLRVRGGRVRVSDERGFPLELERVSIDGHDLTVKAAARGVLPRMGGRLIVRAKTMRLGGLAFGDLVLELRATGRTLQVKSLSFKGLGGEAQLSGTVKLSLKHLATFKLAGKVTLRPFGVRPSLLGRLRLRGNLRRGLQLSGKLRSKGGRVPSASGLSAGFPLKLKVKVGRRRLGGNLRRWQLK